MKKQLENNARLATEKDRYGISKLVELNAYLHQHLDWRSPINWIGYQPYILLESSSIEGKSYYSIDYPDAALVCPEEPPGIAWIRVFAVSNRFNHTEAWGMLWSETQKQLIGYGFSGVIASIPLQNWFRILLEKSDFSHTHDVIGLFLISKNILYKEERSDFRIRLMDGDDLTVVQVVDQTAFPALWRYTLATLKLGLQNSLYSTVIEKDDVIIGYQITTATQNGRCHLARLAVLPEYQGRGLGYLLVQDIYKQLTPRGYSMITVNTQHNNLASLALYDKMGFRPTGDRYPVYELNL